MTNEKNQIVENPLLITELFSGGLYVIPEKKVGKQETVKIEEVVTEKLESISEETPVENIHNQTISVENAVSEIEVKPAEIKFELVHLVDTLGEEICPENWKVAIENISKAIDYQGSKLSTNQFTIIPLRESQRSSSIKVFLESLNTSKIILWSNESILEDWKNNEITYSINNKEILWLPGFNVVTENDSNKRSAWVKIKNFFKE